MVVDNKVLGDSKEYNETSKGGKKTKTKSKNQVNININVKVKILTLSHLKERCQLFKFYWWSIKRRTIYKIEDLDFNINRIWTIKATKLKLMTLAARFLLTLMLTFVFYVISIEISRFFFWLYHKCNTRKKRLNVGYLCKSFCGFSFIINIIKEVFKK